MMNIGHNPTVGENNKTIEVHYFDVNEDLYEDCLERKQDEDFYTTVY